MRGAGREVGRGRSRKNRQSESEGGRAGGGGGDRRAWRLDVTYSYGDVTCTYDDATQTEEAEVAAIAGLGALMQLQGLDAPTALAAARSSYVLFDVCALYVRLICVPCMCA